MQDTLALIQALRSLLLGQETLSKTLSGVFATPVVQDTFPYITLSLEGVEKAPDNTRVGVCLKLWSGYQGVKQIQELFEAVQQTLEKPGLRLEVGPHHAILKRTQQRMEVTPEGVSCVTCQYEALIRGDRP